MKVARKEFERNVKNNVDNLFDRRVNYGHNLRTEE